MIKVLVLGASGMLGSMMADVLSRDSSVTVSATVRSEKVLARLRTWLPGVVCRVFEGAQACTGASLDVMSGHDWIINCIGITKPLIRDDNAADVERAIQINAVLPHRIAAHAARTGARLVQIATDCTYSGARGAYYEDDPHDALDVYGKTKSLGEVKHPGVHHLRCSIIGPEPKEYKFLLEWVRRQPHGARLKGFTNHLWNGVTTLHFARLTLGIIKAGLTIPPVQHIVPADAITKDALLREFARSYGREDIEIQSVEADLGVDRTLRTRRPDVNQTIWKAAGYGRVPGAVEMVHELSQFDYLRPAAA
jgi:dTDP-4-dehydrorhamnose reductase